MFDSRFVIVQRINLDEFERILPTKLVEELAIKFRVDKCNQVRLPGLAVFACLLQTSLSNPVTTQRALEEMYQIHTGKTADHSSFGKRLAKIPVGFFKAIYEHLYVTLFPSAPPSPTNGLRLRFVDATIVTLSAQLINFGLLYTNTGRYRTGSPYRQIKAVFSLTEDGLPSFLRLATAKEENSDSKALGRSIEKELRPNDLWVYDGGCHDRYRMLDIHKRNAFFLTPHSTQALNVQRIVWEAVSQQITQDKPGKEDVTFQLVRVEECRFGTACDKKKFVDLPVLVIHGLRWDTRARKWTPMVLMTNLPLSDNGTKAGSFTFTDVAEVYRRRWDIEIFFKFIKQHIGYSHIVSRTQNGLQVMIYMSLIAALLMTWYKKITKIDTGWRSVKMWIANDAGYWTRELLESAIWVTVPPRKTTPLRI